MPKIYMATDKGNVRPVNEDSGGVFENFFAVADGMGGHAAGETASHMLIEAAERFAKDVNSAQSAEETTHLLKKTIVAANGEIFRRAADDEHLRGMGTTAVLCALRGNIAIFAHVGDSRLYVLRGDELKQLTTDHSYVQELVARGEITPEEAKTHRRKNLLMRAVGVAENVKIDTGTYPLQRNDIILLATDGLTNMLADEEIIDGLRRENPADELIQAALMAGGRDNITAVAVKCDDV